MPPPRHLRPHLRRNPRRVFPTSRARAICALESLRLKSRPRVGLLPTDASRMALPLFILSLLFCCSAVAAETDVTAFDVKHGASLDGYFRDEVWAKVAAQN